MNIKKIKIKNFRNIKNIELDFSVNSAGSKLEVEKGSFKKIPQGKIIPQIIALIGPNAVGKTNIFNALDLIYFLITKDGINHRVASRFLIKNSNDKLNSNPKESQIKNLLEKIKANKISVNDLEDFINMKKEFLMNIFKNESNDLNQKIEFELQFEDEKKSIKTSITLWNSELDIVNGNLLEEEYIVNFFDRREFLFRESGSIIIKNNVISKDASPEELKKFLKLIELADSNIVSILNKKNVMVFQPKNSHVQLHFDSLSSGTKIFILIAKFILKANTKKKGLFIIDEIDTYMHRELSLALIQLMNLISIKHKEVTFMFSTHNPLILSEQIKYKQIHEIKFNPLNGEHETCKLSTLFKQHENLENKYKKGIISSFPSKSFAYDNLYEIVYD